MFWIVLTGMYYAHDTKILILERKYKDTNSFCSLNITIS